MADILHIVSMCMHKSLLGKGTPCVDLVVLVAPLIPVDNDNLVYKLHKL